MYLENEEFITKLIQHVHEKNNHLGVAHTMASIREEWWIPRLRSRVKKSINNCNVCKVFSTKPYGTTETAARPTFRTEVSRPFEYTGVDFAGPIYHRISKKEEDKAYVLIFTCATSRAVHLELTRFQTAEEFRQKLNAFITRRTRPRTIISDNAATFRATTDWIKKIRKSEELNDYLASQSITWQFNLSKSPWWGGLYKRLIKEVKKTLYKTLGKTHLTFEQLETMLMDVERHLNNRPLTYVEDELGEGRIVCIGRRFGGGGANTVRQTAAAGREHVWNRCRKEYIHSLMESHRIQRERSKVPELGEVVLVVGDEKNRGKWKKEKVVNYVTGGDGVVRGVLIRYKEHIIERPLQLVCPLEIRSCEPAPVKPADNLQTESGKKTRDQRPTRDAAKRARELVKTIAMDENDD